MRPPLNSALRTAWLNNLWQSLTIFDHARLFMVKYANDLPKLSSSSLQAISTRATGTFFSSGRHVKSPLLSWWSKMTYDLRLTSVHCRYENQGAWAGFHQGDSWTVATVRQPQESQRQTARCSVKVGLRAPPLKSRVRSPPGLVLLEKEMKVTGHKIHDHPSKSCRCWILSLRSKQNSKEPSYLRKICRRVHLQNPPLQTSPWGRTCPALMQREIIWKWWNQNHWNSAE